ncbi:MAG TPA: hypothetical protein VII71_06450 [Verrucomicrobiae bacterium]
MNDSETNQTHAEISDQIGALQRHVFTLLLMLIVVSGTLTVFLYRQASLTRTDIAGIKPQATQLISTYNQNHAAIQGFVGQLIAFGQTHPDFRPVLQKYGINGPLAAPKK